jgi:Domain of unknown function (DUF4160)
VPRLATFYGIVIWMYRPDHPPPHFHASYGEHVAQMELGSLRVLNGSLPPRRYGSFASGHGFIPRSSPTIGNARRHSGR